MIIVLLGPPGAGKGTQAKRIQERYNLAHISTGDLFREALEEDGKLGRSVKEYLDSGRLVPDELTSAVVAKRIERPDCANGVMLDGYPRTPNQAGALDEMLANRGRMLRLVLYLDVTERTAVERLGGRLTCRECGLGYHVKHMPPRKPGECDRCGGELYQRADDKPDTVRERLKVYAEQTRALVEDYKRRGLLRRIDANSGPEEVTAAVETVMDSFSSRGPV